MPEIIRAENLTERHIAYEIAAPEIASTVAPGQLVLARTGGAYFPMPHAIADVDRDKGTITIVTWATRPAATDDGPAPADGTSDNGAVERMPAIELTGPIGDPGQVASDGKMLCVADGLGVAALQPLIREFKTRGIYTIVIAGYASKDLVYWTDRLDPYSDELYVITEDGSYGVKGPVKHTFKAVCQHVADLDQALAVGPLGLLKACSDIARSHELSIRINLGAVVEQDVAMQGETALESIARFGWENAANIDGLEANFEELTEKLGIQIAK